MGDEHLVQERLLLAKNIHDFVCKSGFNKYQEQLLPLYGENKNVILDGYNLGPIKCDWNAAKEYNFGTNGAFLKKDISQLFKILNVPETNNVPAINIEGFSNWFNGGTYDNQNSDDKKKTNLQNAKWLYGNWLEVWLADQLRQMTAPGGKPLFDEVHQNVVIGDKPDDFEMDVVAVRGYRLFLFSCTVDDKNHVKSKLFEADNRTARIGGEHARAAMVCLHKHPHKVLQTVQAEHWPGYDTLRLFGKPHVEGKEAPCQVIIGSQSPIAVTLQKGIEQWVLPS